MRGPSKQPIETAPADGTPFRAWLPDYDSPFIIAWREDIPAEYGGTTGAWCIVVDQEPPECWHNGVCWDINEFGSPSSQPTHWAPLTFWNRLFG